MTTSEAMKETPNQFGALDIALCVGAALFLAAIEIIFFTPIVWGDNQR